MMQQDEVKQDTELWHTWREKGLGSSDSVVLAGLSPWRSIFDVWTEKVYGTTEIKENWAMTRGKDLEPVARDVYNFDFGVLMSPKTFQHPKYEFIRASSDGYCSDLQYGIEIKCPGKKDLELAKQGLIPAKYYPQLQWLMLASQSTQIDYVSYSGKDEIDVIRCFANERYQRNLIRLAIWFWHKVTTKTEIKRYGITLPPPEGICGTIEKPKVRSKSKRP